jgi:hypothetical protein
MLEDLGVRDEHGLGEKRAGVLPYVTLAAGVVVLLAANWIFTF